MAFGSYSHGLQTTVSYLLFFKRTSCSWQSIQNSVRALKELHQHPQVPTIKLFMVSNISSYTLVFQELCNFRVLFYSYLTAIRRATHGEP